MPILDQLSIQLYTVRDLAMGDFPAVLATLSRIGFTGVEFAGYHGIGASRMRQLLEKERLAPVGSHVPYERLLHNLDQELAYNSVVQTQHIVCPVSRPGNREEVLHLAENLNRIGERCNQAGFGFSYHNHAHEFVHLDGELVMDLLLDNLSPAVGLELDTYWAAWAGVDPLLYLQKHRERIRLLHIKQIGRDGKENVKVAAGRLDFRKLALEGGRIGVEHFILEQEVQGAPAMKAIAEDYSFLMD